MKRLLGYTLNDKEFISAFTKLGAYADGADAAEDEFIGLCLEILAATSTKELEHISNDKLFMILNNYDAFAGKCLDKDVFKIPSVYSNLQNKKSVGRRRVY